MNREAAERRFKEIDTDGDGYVTKDELAAYSKGGTEQAKFIRTVLAQHVAESDDANRDGKVSLDEWLAHRSDPGQQGTACCR
ncbi:EF-hand domain-containing protein [Streptomyces sp. NPDC001665]